MKLPNGAVATVDVIKLSEYCLSTKHIRGRHKARVFASALSIDETHAENLRQALLHAARNEDCSIGASDKYGTRYIIDFRMSHLNKSATIRSIWIVRREEDAPRFVTCYVVSA